MYVCAIMHTYTKTLIALEGYTMQKEIRADKGVYTLLKTLKQEGSVETCVARFTLKDGYTERRLVEVNNGKIIAWQS